jgi:hypothetical protein
LRYLQWRESTHFAKNNIMEYQMEVDISNDFPSSEGFSVELDSEISIDLINELQSALQENVDVSYIFAFAKVL